MRCASLLLAFSFLFSCHSPGSDSSGEQPELKSEIPGTWETVSFRVVINATDSLNEPVVFEVAEGDWSEKMGLQPIRTKFTTDNKFRQEYRNAADSLIRQTRGIWNVFGDTLLLIEPTATYQYQVKPEAGGAIFRCYLDWDGDGQEDDEYVGIQRVVRKD